MAAWTRGGRFFYVLLARLLHLSPCHGHSRTALRCVVRSHLPIGRVHVRRVPHQCQRNFRQIHHARHNERRRLVLLAAQHLVGSSATQHHTLMDGTYQAINELRVYPKGQQLLDHFQTIVHDRNMQCGLL